MTIWEIAVEAFRIALTCRWLWLFGFLVGIWSGGSSGGGSGGGHGVAAGAAASGPPAVANGLAPGGFIEVPFMVLALVAAAAMALAVLLLLRFIGEGALIVGVVRAREGGTMRTRTGLLAGWTHWGVLLRIALLYVAATMVSVLVPAAAVFATVRTGGVASGVVLALLLLLPLVPWLVTLYLVQAFAMRIAVLEHRHAIDAIAKARLFLHGRIALGLKLLVATLAGTLIFGMVAAMTMVPIVFGLVALLRVLPFGVVIALACVVLLPLVCILTAMLGTYRSSVWTLGYVSQVHA